MINNLQTFPNFKRFVEEEVLLRFGLVEAVDLLGKIGDDGVVLLPEGGKSRLVMKGAVVQFLLQFRQFGLAFTIQLNLDQIWTVQIAFGKKQILIKL